jgi:serine/threonine protein kinase
MTGVIVKLVDFGLARSVNVSQVDQITQIGDVLGSPAYMSPEQARGELLR